jgi:hypothetical protein
VLCIVRAEGGGGVAFKGDFELHRSRPAEGGLAYGCGRVLRHKASYACYFCRVKMYIVLVVSKRFAPPKVVSDDQFCGVREPPSG